MIHQEVVRNASASLDMRQMEKGQLVPIPLKAIDVNEWCASAEEDIKALGESTIKMVGSINNITCYRAEHQNSGGLVRRSHRASVQRVHGGVPEHFGENDR